MSRVAIFVDAGYLFAQGSAALTGEKRARSETKLNETAVLAELTAVAKAKCDGTRLLRTYWYDAPLGSGMSAQHIALANTDHVKMRLGALNGQGQQKGVDSLIVTDLIELARNKSICDAVLLSGDEDVRIGVQIAQNYGVAVHLIGIHPARGSQSPALRQEADTNTEWDKDTIGRFLTVAVPARPDRGAVPAAEVAAAKPQGKAIDKLARSTMEGIVAEMIGALDSDGLNDLDTFWASGAKGLPAELDRPFLGKCRDAMGRKLSPEELREGRIYFAAQAKALIDKRG
jgi:uncharacterized LabA/DUF88 family protein